MTETREQWVRLIVCLTVWAESYHLPMPYFSMRGW